MVVEKFDCGLLHLEEAKEVLLNVHAKWWGNKIEGFRYLLDETLADRDLLLAKENISLAEIPIGNIKVIPLDENVKEPITIDVNGTKVGFVFPRIRNSAITANLIKQKFAKEEQEFFKTKQIIKWNDSQKDVEKKKILPESEAEAYREFLSKKSNFDLLCTRAQLICSINGKLLDTFEDRFDILEKDETITVQHWLAYNEFLKGQGNFGVQEDVEFFSDVLGKSITRRFPFRTFSFLPTISVETAGFTSAKISFG
ncbi:MAG: hypothetical protein ACRCZZ_07510 [Phocaeicola sp.]